MITAKQVWTEVFRKDENNRDVRVEQSENKRDVVLIIANPDDHFYVEVTLSPRDALALADRLTRAGTRTGAATRPRDSARSPASTRPTRTA